LPDTAGQFPSGSWTKSVEERFYQDYSAFGLFLLDAHKLPESASFQLSVHDATVMAARVFDWLRKDHPKRHPRHILQNLAHACDSLRLLSGNKDPDQRWLHAMYRSYKTLMALPDVTRSNFKFWDGVSQFMKDYGEMFPDKKGQDLAFWDREHPMAQLP